MVQNAVGTLDKLLSEAKAALAQVQAETFKLWHVPSDGGVYDHPRGAMAEILQELYEVLLVVPEAAEMPQSRASLVTAWADFGSLPRKLEHTDDDSEYDYSSSPALTFLERIIKGLRTSVIAEFSSEDGWT